MLPAWCLLHLLSFQFDDHFLLCRVLVGSFLCLPVFSDLPLLFHECYSIFHFLAVLSSFISESFSDCCLMSISAGVSLHPSQNFVRFFLTFMMSLNYFVDLVILFESSYCVNIFFRRISSALQPPDPFVSLAVTP